MEVLFWKHILNSTAFYKLNSLCNFLVTHIEVTNESLVYKEPVIIENFLPKNYDIVMFKSHVISKNVS